MKQTGSPKFSIEHPIHQPPYKPSAARRPFDAQNRFKAQNILYTPLVFRSKKIGGLTLESRFHLSSGAPVEEILWLNPFITDGNGSVAWQTGNGYRRQERRRKSDVGSFFCQRFGGANSAR